MDALQLSWREWDNLLFFYITYLDVWLSFECKCQRQMLCVFCIVVNDFVLCLHTCSCLILPHHYFYNDYFLWNISLPSDVKCFVFVRTSVLLVYLAQGRDDILRWYQCVSLHWCVHPRHYKDIFRSVEWNVNTCRNQMTSPINKLRSF